jgi:hypothetical protein
LGSILTGISTTSPETKNIESLEPFACHPRGLTIHSKSVRTNKSESVRAALDNVSQAFKLAARPDPRLNVDGKFAFILQRQLRGYRTTDKPEIQQVAITGSVLHEFYHLSLSNIDKARCKLFIRAFFFNMHSCKYLKKYPAPEKPNYSPSKTSVFIKTRDFFIPTTMFI